MITPPTDCFYIVRAEGEAVEHIMASLSMSAMADITVAVLISKDFSDDMSATIELDQTVEALKSTLGNNLIERVVHNPLYFPSSQDDIDEVLDGEIGSDNFSFVGLDGNPYTLKTVNVAVGELGLIEAKVACKPFDLPCYAEIVAAQGAVRLQ